MTRARSPRYLLALASLSIFATGIPFLTTTRPANQAPPSANPRHPDIPQTATPTLSNKNPDQADLWKALGEARRNIRTITSDPEISAFAHHPGQQLSASFRPDGSVSLRGTPADTWTFSMSYSSASGESRLSTAGTRAEWQHPDGVVEWFDNREQGIEHGFTLAARPASSANGDIALNIRLQGLTPTASAGGKDIVLTSQDHTPHLLYAGLKVNDADGRLLPASMYPENDGICIAFNDRDAAYPLTVDPLITTVKERLDPEVPTDGDSINQFSQAIAFDGEFAFVGAPYDRIPGGDMSGSVYVFQRGNGTWQQVAWLTPPQAATMGRFGAAIVLQGDTAFIGAPAGEGRVHVYSRSANIWSHQAVLAPSAARPDGNFGAALAVSGDRLIVGAPDEIDGLFPSPQYPGHAYIFIRQADASWTETAKLSGPGSTIPDVFGYAVDIEGDQAVVGMPGYDDYSLSPTGAVHVFTFANGTWSAAAKLQAANSDTKFGMALDLQGSNLIVGAPEGGINGQAFVFTGSGATWSAGAELVSTSEDRLGFGRAVALDGDRAIVGAPGILYLQEQAPGSIHFFTRNSGTWSASGELGLADGFQADLFGFPIVRAGDSLLVGMGSATNYSDYPVRGGERVLVYTGQGESWTQQATLTANDGGDGYHYGSAVALDGDRCLVGVPYDPDFNDYRIGSAYLLSRASGTWTTETVFKNDFKQVYEFGLSVALENDTAVVGSEEGAFVYRKHGDAWELDAPLAPSEHVEDDKFGGAVAISAGRIAVGAPFIHYRRNGRHGKVFIFDRGETSWNQVALLKADETHTGYHYGDLFGNALAFDGNRLLVGAPASYMITQSGMAYTFVEQDGVWTKEASFSGERSSYNSDRFGDAVALQGDTLLIGAPVEGRAYTYHRIKGDWKAGPIFSGEDEGEHSYFGHAVALDGDYAAVGVPRFQPEYHGTVPTTPGSVHVFTRDGFSWTRDLRLNGGPATGDGFGFSVAMDAGTVLVGAPFDEFTTSPVGNLTPDQGSAWFFELRAEHEVFLSLFDADSNDLLSAGEWLSIYPKAPKKEAAFALIDSDASGGLSTAELKAARTLRGVKPTLGTWLDRSAAFIELDADANGRVTREEIRLMWKPATPAKNIDATWTRMQGGTGLGLAQWIKAPVLPSLATYEVAKTMRSTRRAAFKSRDWDENEQLSRAEFQYLFYAVLQPKALDAAWRAATGTPRKQTPPDFISLPDFIEAPKLPRLAE